MDNKKTKVKGRAQRVFILMIPIILAVIATVLLAMTMGGGFSTPTPTPMTDEPEATTRSDIPVGIDPENTPDTASKGLSFSVGADGNATVTGLGGCSDRVITVPTVTADGARVTAIADNAFAYATGITEVILPSGLVTIGDYAFRGSSIACILFNCETAFISTITRFSTNKSARPKNTYFNTLIIYSHRHLILYF